MNITKRIVTRHKRTTMYSCEYELDCIPIYFQTARARPSKRKRKWLFPSLVFT